MKSIILLIGAGQLGSRHLQGLLRLEKKLNIFVLDPSEQSLEIARERAKEIPNNHLTNYLTDWDLLPKRFNIVIVATGANVREMVVTKLLEGFKVDYLILEKILFQKLEDYKKIENLIKRLGLKTWVNHPRRMMKPYKVIKNIILQNNEIASFQVFGGNWGLACNGLHFIDLFAYLTGSSIETIDGNWIDSTVHKSKRLNHIEFTGTLKGRMKDSSCFTISSMDGSQEPISICISTKSNRWLIQEGSIMKVIHLAKDNDFEEHIGSFNMLFQSVLTTNLIQDILESGKCDLPTYNEACQSHVPFITTLLQKHNELLDLEVNICPIT